MPSKLTNWFCVKSNSFINKRHDPWVLIKSSHIKFCQSNDRPFLWEKFSLFSRCLCTVFFFITIKRKIKSFPKTKGFVHFSTALRRFQLKSLEIPAWIYTMNRVWISCQLTVRMCWVKGEIYFLNLAKFRLKLKGKLIDTKNGIVARIMTLWLITVHNFQLVK